MQEANWLGVASAEHVQTGLMVNYVCIPADTPSTSYFHPVSDLISGYVREIDEKVSLESGF